MRGFNVPHLLLKLSSIDELISDVEKKVENIHNRTYLTRLNTRARKRWERFVGKCPNPLILEIYDKKL